MIERTHEWKVEASYAQSVKVRVTERKIPTPEVYITVADSVGAVQQVNLKVSIEKAYEIARMLKSAASVAKEAK